MHLQESGEMYLESIHVLLHQRGQVRAVDVSEYMGYSKPSVSCAIGLLRAGGYLTVEDGGWLHLTELGFAAAEKIYERHRVLTLWLTRIGVSRECAAEDACRIEHVISDESFLALKRSLGLPDEDVLWAEL